MNISNVDISESLLKNAGVPKLDDLMGGYVLDGNKLKADIKYWMSEYSDDIDRSEDGIILLYSDSFIIPSAHWCNTINTTLTLEVIPPSMAFIYFLTDYRFISSGRNIILPNGKQKVTFTITSKSEDSILNKGEEIGYGFFIPIVPMDNIKLNKQENAT